MPLKSNATLRRVTIRINAMKIISLKGSNAIAALATMHQSPVLYLYFRSLSALMALGMSFAFRRTRQRNIEGLDADWRPP